METTTIDFDAFALIKKLWFRKFQILFVASIFATISLAISAYVLTPMYTSTTRIYVGNQVGEADRKLTTQDFQVGDYLVKDYREIIISKDVLVTVIEQEGLTMSRNELLNKLSVATPANTRILSITVKDSDPSQATRLANAVRDVAVEKIQDITLVESVRTMEVAEDAERPSSPNLKRNAALGFLVGGFLTVLVILLGEILNDRVRQPEDIEDVLGITLLGVVPNTNQK